MKILVTGSAGHLGEALMRSLQAAGHQPLGLDVKPSEFTHRVGSIVDRRFVAQCLAGCDAVIHTATLHKPHVGTHTRQAFIDTNITGTLNLLEEAVAQSCGSFVYTSTTSTFGDAMRPAPGEPAVWVTESLRPQPKNIYGVSKTAAEELCALFHRNTGLACLVLKTSRFFAEEDDAKDKRETYSDDNLKVNELLFRRADLADIVTAHQLAIAQAQTIGFDKFIISGSTPFQRQDAQQLGLDAPSVVEKYVPEFVDVFASKGWHMFPSIDRVYDNTHARTRLGWQPEYTFENAVKCLASNQDYKSELARTIGKKGYHMQQFAEGPYPTTDF